MRRLACRIAQRRLAVSGGECPRGAAGRHLAHCIRCQAEAARYRKLGRNLAALADEHEPAPPGLVDAVDRALSGLQPVPALAVAKRGPAAVAAMLGAAAATAGTVVVVRMLRARDAA